MTGQTRKGAGGRSGQCRRPIERREARYLERLAGALRVWRQTAGLTQAELAAGAQVHRATVQRIEAGTRRTRSSTLQRVAAVLADRLDVTDRELHAELVKAAGPALAPESDYAERVAARRERRNAVRWVEVDGTRMVPTADRLAQLRADGWTLRLLPAPGGGRRWIAERP